MPLRPGATSGGADALPGTLGGVAPGVGLELASSLGPADLYVVELRSDSLPTAVTAFLRDGATVGVMTLLDVVLIRRSSDGHWEAVETDEFADELGLAGVMPRTPGLVRREDLLARADNLPDGVSWLVMLMENTWARSLIAAVDDADADLVEVQRFSPVQ